MTNTSAALYQLSYESRLVNMGTESMAFIPRSNVDPFRNITKMANGNLGGNLIWTSNTSVDLPALHSFDLNGFLIFI